MDDISKNYPLHWGGHGFELKAAETLREETQKDLDRWINQYDERDFIEKPLEGDGDEPVLKHNEGYEGKNFKYEIAWDERSCYDWCWIINGEVVTDPEKDEELLDYTLAKLKEHIKRGYSDFRSLMECFQNEDYIFSQGNCETCGHHGGKTIWKI